MRENFKYGSVRGISLLTYFMNNWRTICLLDMKNLSKLMTRTSLSVDFIARPAGDLSKVNVRDALVTRKQHGARSGPAAWKKDTAVVPTAKRLQTLPSVKNTTIP